MVYQSPALIVPVVFAYQKLGDRPTDTRHHEISYDSQHPVPMEFKVPTVKTVICPNQRNTIRRPETQSIDTIFEQNGGFQPNGDHFVGYQRVQAHPSYVGRYDRAGVSRD